MPHLPQPRRPRHRSLVQVMLALAAATADHDAAAIWRKNQDDRRTGMTMFAADLAATGRLRPEHTVETAADVLWLAMDVRNYDWLVRQRGWPVEHYRRWYVDTVAAALLTTSATPLPEGQRDQPR
jgi:TetR/AcrR family transcriptional regulator, regulator of autoinduction and epiphytic fitness